MSYESGRKREAIEAFENSLRALPNRIDVTVGLILSLGDCSDSAVRDTRRAVDLARAALPCAPVDESALAGIPAEQRQQLHLQPKLVWNVLGFALICDGRWKEGLEAAAHSVELGYEEDGTDWVYGALANARLGDLAAARELHDRAEAWFAEHPASDERFSRRRAEVARLLAEAERR